MSVDRVASWLAMTPPRRAHVRSVRRSVAAAIALALGITGLIAAGPAANAAPDPTYKRACGDPTPHHATCFAIYRTTPTGAARPNTTAGGYTAQQIQAAYNLPSTTGGVGRTIAIVDAYDLPNAEAVLGTYRTEMGLPACTTANGCFQKVNQNGDPSPLPAQDAGWNIETALDLDMVSAACPNCSIYLVEATSNATNNLASAAAQGAAFAEAVSNSYGSNESPTEASNLDPFYSVPGVVYTASSGDSGFSDGPHYPAASPDVVTVGGTTLNHPTSSTWTESAWAGTGGGCSAYELKPAWQPEGDCTMRTEVDVAAVADPSTGVAAYGPFGAGGANQWAVLGGTSASAPIVAGAYEVAGGVPVQKAARLLYDRGGAHLNDVTDGQTKSTCGDVGDPTPTYLCKAQAGYDGPTGMGTPNGVQDLRSIAGVADFDALGNTMFSVYRPSSHTWYARNSSFYPTVWGTTGDIPVPADYFGDSFTDAAVYRPSNHGWYIKFLSGSTPVWGTAGDIPVPADYNGDGVADLTMYRPSNHTWYALNLVTGTNTHVAWGASHDTPVPGDYNGDGVTEQAVYRPSTHQWWVHGMATVTWGKSGDVPVPGDYNGDGVTDIAVWRPSTHQWWVQGSSPVTWGGTNDKPQPGDYNGDGKTDFATWRPSNGKWYVDGVTSVTWGQNGDTPLVLPYAILRTH
jgi:hypothetical protein